MPNFNAEITGFAVGDPLIVRRTIDRVLSSIPNGILVTKAWLTIKADLADTDANAIVQKEITTTDVPGTGQIEDDGTGDVDIIVRFDLGQDDTRNIGHAHRVYDIQVLFNDATSSVYTGERGIIYGEKEVTVTNV